MVMLVCQNNFVSLQHLPQKNVCLTLNGKSFE